MEKEKNPAYRDLLKLNPIQPNKPPTLVTFCTEKNLFMKSLPG